MIRFLPEKIQKAKHFFKGNSIRSNKNISDIPEVVELFLPVRDVPFLMYQDEV